MMTVEVRITLRLPRELHARLSRAINENKRSLNTEIVSRLEATFQSDPDPVNDRLTKLENHVSELQQALNLVPAAEEINMRKKQGKQSRNRDVKLGGND